MQEKKLFIGNFFCLLLGIFFFSYVAARAYLLSITHDEAFSWNNVVGHSVMEIISYNTSPGPGTPNNHILNSLLMKFFGWIFGPSTFVLRLPNLLAYLFYLLFSFLICKKLIKPILVVSGFVLLNINPYNLEFFALARGYGLANALMMGSIYFLLNWKENKKQSELIFTFVCASLSVLANFSLLQFYLGLFVVVNLIFISGKNFPSREIIKLNFYPFVFTVFLAGILYEPLRKIIKWHETFGGSTGFWDDTAKSEMNCFWYGQNYRFFLSGILEGLVIVLSLMILLAWAKTILKKNFNATIFSLGGLLFLPVFIHILEHALFKTEFLSGRTAQYFVPLFLIAVIFSFASLFEKTSTVWIGAFSFLGLTHFFIAENLSYTSEWKYDCENKKAIEYLNRICKNDEMHPLQLTSNWMLEPGVNFYLSTQKIKNISPVHRENNLSENFDVYYVLASDTEQLQNRGKKILQGFPLSKTYVMK